MTALWRSGGVPEKAPAPKKEQNFSHEPFPWYIEWVLVALVCVCAMIVVTILGMVKVYFLGAHLIKLLHRGYEYLRYEVISI